MSKLSGLSFVFIFAVLCFAGCSPSQHDAVEYNDMIIEEQRAIDNTEQAMIAALEDSTAVEPAYTAYMKQVDISSEKIGSLESFGEGHELKDAAMKLITAYRSAGSTEYSEIVSIMKRSDARISEEDKQRVSDLLSEVYKKLNTELSEFNKAQEAFAKQYGIQIEEATGKK
jgi:ribosomal protein S20